MPAMFEEILKIANRYNDGYAKVKERRDQWLHKSEELREHLMQIADHLNNNATYKQGFYVDTLHAFNEDIRGTSNRMPSVAFRSGPMPMLVTFRNSMGEKKTYDEEGFSISFNPTITGQVLVLLQPHYSDLDKKLPEMVSLGMFQEPGEITMEEANELIKRGMEEAFYSSFTGMAFPPQDEEAENTPPQRTLIGFKRHDTTQKI